jgi:hypothetical protein
MVADLRTLLVESELLLLRCLLRQGQACRRYRRCNPSCLMILFELLRVGVRMLMYLPFIFSFV